MSKYILQKAGLAFDEKKAVSALKKCALQLITIIEHKKMNVKVKRAKICGELDAGMVQQAQIEVEQVIRDDIMIKAFDVLRCECFRVEDRIGSVASSKGGVCPSDLEQAICTIIWAADRIQGSEFTIVKAMLAKKFGKDFTRKAEMDEEGCVNPKVADKLRFQFNHPPQEVVDEYLVGIAKEGNVDFRPSTPPTPPSLDKYASTKNKIKVNTDTSAATAPAASLTAKHIASRFYASARPVTAARPARGSTSTVDTSTAAAAAVVSTAMTRNMVGGVGSGLSKQHASCASETPRKNDVTPIVIAYMTI